MSAPVPIPDLEDCRVFLRDKYINEVFYEGRWRSRACIVKCSSKCPWSIGNEYRLGRRMFVAAPSVVAEPFAYADGRPAAVAVARVRGPSLTELLARGLTEMEADSFAQDILTLATALAETGILHRDLFADNLLLDADGHLKAIDWQLAIDRQDYREDPWVVRHWKFRYVVFGVNRELGLGVWNDFHALGKILDRFPRTPKVCEVRRRLASEAPSQTFAAPPDGLTRLKLRLYAASLAVQMCLNRRHPEKFARLRRRYATIQMGWRSHR